MAWVAMGRHAGGGGGCSTLLASVGVRVALIHGSPSCNEKWHCKWNSVKFFLPLANSTLNTMWILIGTATCKSLSEIRWNLVEF